MESYIGKICPYCKTEIREGEAVTVCPDCGIPHHQSCWEENRGCTTFGCAQQHYEAQHTNPTAVCRSCGAPLGDGQSFCPRCGTAKDAPQKRFCAKCGAELQEGQAFCSQCGQKAELDVDAAVNDAISQFNAGVAQQAAKKKKTPLIIGAAAAAAVVLVLILALTGRDKGPDFHKVFDDCDLDYTYATLASDGSYLAIDTNPYDEDDYVDYAAWLSLYTINEYLGLPDSLMEDMGHTSSLDGKQSETFDDITVTWKYHPDRGLEVTYKANNR